jgi:FTR1 family protein
MGAGVVTLREGFEASLVVGIVLAFLDRTGRRDGFLAVWIGAMAAVALSIAFGVGLFLVGAELEGTAEAVWEGGTMLVAAALLTWMVFWMRSQSRTIRKELEGRVQAALATGSSLALATVAFVGVAREGLETSLFLFSSTEGGKSAFSVVAGLVGLVLAVALGYAFYRFLASRPAQVLHAHERPAPGFRRVPARERSARARRGRNLPGERGASRRGIRRACRANALVLLPPTQSADSVALARS